MEPIDINGLTFQIDNRMLLRDFSLRVASGEKVMLSGPSGCGKTTLLRCILGLVIPQSGVIRILGRALNAASVWELRRHLAYVAQEPDLGVGTVREVLAQPFRFKANAALRGNIERVPCLMDRFRLPAGLLDKFMPTLSGGERQRVALISAILLERPIILLDEASAALDPVNRDAVIDYFRQAGEVTVLSVSHDREWMAFCGRSLSLDGASSVLTGAPQS